MDKKIYTNYIDTYFYIDNQEISYFAYLEEEIGIWIFIENINNRNIMLEEIVKAIIAEYIKEIEYSRDKIIYLFNYIYDKYLIEGMNIFILLSDYNSIIYLNKGNIEISVIKDNKKINIKNTDISEYIDISIDTRIIIQNNTHYNSIEAINILDAIKDGNTEEILQDISTGIREYSQNNTNTSCIILMVNKVQNDSKIVYKKSKKINKPLLIFSILLVIVLAYYINTYRIIIRENKIIDKIQKYNKEIDAKNYINAKILLKDSIYDYNNITKMRYTYISRNKINDISTKIAGYKENLSDVETMIEIDEDIVKADSEYDSNRYDVALQKYKDIDNKLEKIKLEKVNLEKYIDDKIKVTKALGKVKAEEQLADKYMEEEDYAKAYEIYNSIQQLYLDNNKQEYISSILIDKIKKAKEIIDMYNDNIDILMKEARDNVDKKYMISKKIYEEALTLSEKINNIDKSKIINNMIKEIENNISYANKQAIEYHNKAIEDISNKKYNAGISVLEETLNIYEKLEDVENISIIKKKIIDTKRKNKNEENKKAINKVIDKKYLENSMKKTIKYSEEKGDEYLRNNRWDKGAVEYQRALSVIEELGDETNKKRIEEKLKYAKQKMGKEWWEVWK